MGRNEIRLRRQRMSSGKIAQHRNYAEVMRQHEHDVKFKRIFRVFVYFLIILVLIILLVIVFRWEKRANKKAFVQPSELFVTPPRT
jgi:hypothetical protein